MLRNGKFNQFGFTLIELIIATAIIGGISVASIQLLYDTVTSRAKQNSVENTSANIRFFVDSISRSIESATSVSIPSANIIQITGAPCKAYSLDTTLHVIKEAVDANPICDATTLTPVTVIPLDNTTFTQFAFSPIGNFPAVVNMTIDGSYKDNFSTHPFHYSTAVTPRITL